MIIRAAQPEEFAGVMEFYDALIDAMRDWEFKPKWEKGVYPGGQFIQDSLNRNELFVADEGGSILGAVIINHDCAAGYDTVQWGIEAEKSEVAVIHALGVSPRRQGRGIAKRMLAFAAETGKRKGVKAIRLDVLAENLPAQKLYAAAGFTHRETVKLFYEDTGLMDFLLFELVLA